MSYTISLSLAFILTLLNFQTFIRDEMKNWTFRELDGRKKQKSFISHTSVMSSHYTSALSFRPLAVDKAARVKKFRTKQKQKRQKQLNLHG